MTDIAMAYDRQNYRALKSRLEEIAESLVWCRKRADRLSLPGTAAELRSAAGYVDSVIYEMSICEQPEFAAFRETEKASDG